VLAPSFADIFSSNAFKNGMLLVALPQDQIDRLMEVAATDEITVDLESQTVTTPFQDRFTFEIDAFRKSCLLGGIDEIGLTEAQDDAIGSYEARLAADKPWVGGAARRAA
jgi:3-isopropylmalate/(R)-2-methylmalate dehydratase small subunit